jgi:L-cysteate sulfo-lyase
MQAEANDAKWAWLVQINRLPLGFTPTPLHALDRLSDELGGPRIWLKRDDCTGLATGGNKTRKLEYLLADALANSADTVVTFGAVQSNHARQTAAACAVAGLECHLILTRRVQWKHPQFESAGNVLLDDLLGAKVHIIDMDDAQTYVRELRSHLKSQGRSVYMIPAGGSNAVGALGYVRCAMELEAQALASNIQPARIYHASSSAGTQSGLVVGATLWDKPPEVHGINVYHASAQDLVEQVKQITDQVVGNHALDLDTRDAIHVDQRYFGEDYGQPTPATLEAIRLAASLEGVLFDPVYSGKGFSGLVDQMVTGEIGGLRDVIFIHTGGTASLGVYDNAF